MIDWKCALAACLFFTSNTLWLVHGILSSQHQEKSHDTTVDDADSTLSNNTTNTTTFFETWKELDPILIEEMWQRVTKSNQTKIMMISAAFIGSMAWCLLCAPILETSWILSHRGRRMIGLHIFLASLAVATSMVELLGHLMLLGMTNSCAWMAMDFNLSDWTEEGDDGTGWRVLEMITIVSHGLLLWINSFEYLAFFGIQVIICYSVSKEASKTKQNINNSNPDNDNSENQQPQSTAPTPPSTTSFSRAFAYFGLFVGILSLLNFISDILRFIDWSVFGRMSMLLNILLGLIFLPIWLLWLGGQLPKALGKLELVDTAVPFIVKGDDDVGVS